MQRILSISLFFLLITFDATGNSDGPRVESISGAQDVKVTRGRKVGKVKAGFKLSPGDRVETGAATLRIIYPDGSQLMVGKNSSMEIQAKKSNVQWNYLRSGRLRAVVPSTPPGAKGEKKPFRFGTRTKSAVMGVRGTDYMVESKGELSELTTYEGEVEIHNNENELLGNKGISVLKEQFIQAANKTSLSRPKRLDPTVLKSRASEFESILKIQPKSIQELEHLRSQRSAVQRQASQTLQQAKDIKVPKLPEAPPVPQPPAIPKFGR